MKRIRALIFRDFKELKKNMVLFTTLLLPLLLGLLFINMDQTPEFEIGVVDRLPENLEFIRATELINLEEEFNIGGRGADYPQVILEPEENFDQKMATGQRPRLNIITDTRENNPALNLIHSTLNEYYYRQAGLEAPLEVNVDVTGERRRLEYLEIMLGLFISMGIIIVGIYIVPSLLIIEKEYGTLKALIASGTSLKQITVAKLITGFILSLAVPLILVLMSGNVEFAWEILLPALILGGLIFTILGLILGVLIDESSTLNSFSSVLMLVFLAPALLMQLIYEGMITGIGEAFDWLLYILPSYWLLEGINASFIAVENLRRVYYILGVNIVILIIVLYYCFRRYAESQLS